MEVLTYHCPNCGAPLKFSGESQRWDCEFCRSTFAAEELQKIEEQQQAEQPLNRETAKKKTESNGAKSYSCPSCGAEMITEEGTAASFCAFCGNPTIFPKELSGDFQPEKIIPFRYTKEQAVAALETLCKKKPLLPSDFSSKQHIQSVTGIYVPFWLFDCSMNVRMDAMAQRVHSWSDGNYRYTKTDHYRLEREGKLAVQGVPADGLQRMGDDLMDGLEPFDYSTMTDFQFSYLSGYFAERYDVSKEASWPQAERRIEQAARSLTEQTMQGYVSRQITNFQTSVCDKETHYAMLPVWLLSTNYDGKTYLLAMNGQTGKTVGNLPMSKGKMAKWFGIVAGAAFAVCMIGGLFL